MECKTTQTVITTCFRILWTLATGRCLVCQYQLWKPMSCPQTPLAAHCHKSWSRVERLCLPYSCRQSSELGKDESQTEGLLMRYYKPSVCWNFCHPGCKSNKLSCWSILDCLLNLSVFLSQKFLEHTCMVLKSCAGLRILLQLFRQEIVLSTITGKIVRLSCLAWRLPWSLARPSYYKTICSCGVCERELAHEY